MALEVGTTLGPYSVTAKIGEGGMGEVYRARDTKLDRDVALKVLPQAFTDDPDRLARFEREAKVLASLNHPNIGGIHGLEESEDVRALVLEYIDGPTLADRIAQGPIPVDEALPIAKQIAEALEAAHEQGVIHRDLKPANVKVKSDGTVKVLDFGLAKAMQPDASDPHMSQSPTISLTAAATQMGMVIGTAAYMAPEQASGKVVDKRADVWAFGVVLYEMLTGTRPFVGDDVSKTLAHVIAIDPDWSTLPKVLPPVLTNFLRGCLEKEPRKRIRDIGDVRLAMEGTFETTAISAEEAGVSQPSGWRQALPLAVSMSAVAVVITGLAVWTLMRGAGVAPRVERFSIALPPGASLPASNHKLIALSPGGTHLAFVAKGQLYLRPVDQLEATPLPRTEGATEPFFSPSGQWIGFWVNGQLKKVQVTGDAPVTLSDVGAAPYGVTWGHEDTILFNEYGVGLWRVPGTGGTPDLILPATDETAGYVRPQFLPGGDLILYSTFPSRDIETYSLATGERQLVFENSGGDVWYLPTGHIAFVRNNTLLAVPFDAELGATTGGPVPLIDGVRQSGPGTAQLALGDNGTLVYLPAGETTIDSTLGWVSREGAMVTPLSDGIGLAHPRLSPDGTRVAHVEVESDSAFQHLFINSLESGREQKLTEAGLQNANPVWTPDSTTVTFATDQEGGAFQLYARPVDLSTEAEPVLPTEVRAIPASWTLDGQTLVYYTVDAQGARDIWRFPVGGEPVPFLATAFNERAPRLSPNGKWLAYISDQFGEDRVLVQAFPEGGAVLSVSTGPGTEAVWSRDGQELFYRNGNQMWAVEVETGTDFSAGSEDLLFEAPYDLDDFGNANYDVSLDGQQFLMVRGAATETPRLVFVRNWFEELKERVPVP